METALFTRNALLPKGWAKDVRLSIAKDGTLAAICEESTAQAGDFLADIAVPGMSNVHCHAFQRAMAGLAECAGPKGDSFWTWRETMYRIAQGITPQNLHAIATMAYMEMLECGFTAVGEFHYLHHAAGGQPYANPAEMSAQLIQAAALTGISQTLLPVFYARGGFDDATLSGGQQRFGHDLDSFATLMSAIQSQFPDTLLGIAPHSLRAVSPAQLSALATCYTDIPIHLHIAEQPIEVNDCIACYGTPPIRWLFDHIEVDQRWCLIHATHMDVKETHAIARSGAVVGLCPITEANLGDGIFPATDHLAHNGRIGIGSDSCVRIDLAEELRLLDYGQRLSSQTRTPLAAPSASSGRTLFELALKGGAQALAQNAGALETGKQANIVTLDANHPALIARQGNAWLDGWIYGAAKNPVRDVFVAGKQVVHHGEHTNRDMIMAGYKSAMGQIQSGL
jgi:formimidoylglutamate deiminase